MHVEPCSRSEPLPQLVAGLSGEPGLCWLDGGSDGSTGPRRYSFVGCSPRATVVRDGRDADPLAALSELSTTDGGDARADGGNARADGGNARADGGNARADGGDALGAAVDRGSANGPQAHEVPAWAGFIAYDAHFPYTTGRPCGDGHAVLCFHRYDAWLVVDHSDGRRFLVGDDGDSCRALGRKLDAAAVGDVGDVRPRARPGSCRGSSGRAHVSAIGAALEHIAAGDVYQVNLARHYDAPIHGEPLAMAMAMRAQGEVPFGLYFDEGPRVVIGRSMERFLRWQRSTGALQCCPIKGTLARDGRTDARDAAALRADPKEQAEHAMIVDLMRNDLGRVAAVGTVQVADLMRVEPYARLSHLVSTVGCTTRPGLTLSELLRATFPPGSVTGAPKRRALQIIEDLEPARRGIYTGAYGFVDRAGGCSLSVAIRTAVVEGQRVRYHAGGGIVEASDPQRELLETQLKASVFVDAVAQLAGGEAHAAHPPAPTDEPAVETA